MWFLNYKYEDLISLTKLLRNLYIPLSVFCSTVIFIMGYTKITSSFTAPKFETISNNMYIITFTIKMAGFSFSIGLVGYILSCLMDYILDVKRITESLIDTLFKLKASHLKIDQD